MLLSALTGSEGLTKVNRICSLWTASALHPIYLREETVEDDVRIMVVTGESWEDGSSSDHDDKFL